MCGIAGVVGREPARDRSATVAAMVRRLAHRGPDGEGLMMGPHFAIGHRRLAVIDPAGGAQPMECPEGRYIVSFNGELYNYIELRRELEADGISFRTNSDTEVLLHLLSSEGERGLTRLIGMFAFALYDRSERRLLLARDHFGVKPLYYAETASGELAFASEIKALFEHSEITPRRDDASLQEYLTFQFCLAGATLFQGVRQLRPGWLLCWQPGRPLETRPFWDIDFTVDDHHTQQYFDDALTTLLDDSVRLQLRSDVPLGAHLSGGLDSSLVAAFADRRIPTGLHLFHGRFEAGERYDESYYARTMAERLRGSYHEVSPTACDFVESMPQLVYHMDEPSAGPGLFAQYMVAREAAGTVKVTLGGQGGDEVFGGYARYLVAYLEQALKGAIHGTQEEGRHLVTLSSIVPNLAVLRDYVPLMQQFWSHGLFQPMDMRYFHLINRSRGLETFLIPDLLARRRENELFERFRDEFNHPDTVSYINKMTHFDLKNLLPALLQVEDRVSMAVSIESRVPLLDHRVVELVASMPPAMKFCGGRLKYALRRVAARYLPETVLSREDKMGFPVPLAEWLRSGVVRDFVGDVLTDRPARERGLVSPQAVEQLLASEQPFGRQVWALLCLELWHRAFGLA